MTDKGRPRPDAQGDIVSGFRQAVLSAFVIGTALNLWFLLGAQAGYKFYGIVQQLDAASGQAFALRVEGVLVIAASAAWWVSGRR